MGSDMVVMLDPLPNDDLSLLVYLGESPASAAL